MLRLLKYNLGRNSMFKIYTAFIRPILEYTYVVWDNCTTEKSDLLETVQLEAARIITGLKNGPSHQLLYNELGIEPLSVRRKQHKLNTFFRIQNNETPYYLKEVIQNHNCHDRVYNVRSSNLSYPTYLPIQAAIRRASTQAP